MEDWKSKYKTLVRTIQQGIRTNNALLAESAARGDHDSEHYIKIGRHQAYAGLFTVIDEQDQAELDKAA